MSCAIGLAVLQVIEDEKLQSSARNVGRFLVENLRAIQHKHPMIGDVRLVCRAIAVRLRPYSNKTLYSHVYLRKWLLYILVL